MEIQRFAEELRRAGRVTCRRPMTDFKALLRDSLSDAGVEFILIGGVAAAVARLEPELTFDTLTSCIGVRADNMARLVAALAPYQPVSCAACRAGLPFRWEVRDDTSAASTSLCVTHAW